MNTVNIKNVEIGQGIPKICIPIIGKNREEILRELKLLKEQKPDLAEWRVDCYEEGKQEEKIWEMLKTITDKIGEIPLIFTFRTAGEGGNQEISFTDYVKLLQTAARTGLADLIDVEAFFREEETAHLIGLLKQEGVSVIASNHHFHRTPSADEIAERMKKMERYGADILKMAVMPQSRREVCTLLEASIRISEECSKPIVTMSMGKTGVLSRICGEYTGSCITFAAGEKASAPGQVKAEKLREILEKIHELEREQN